VVPAERLDGAPSVLSLRAGGADKRARRGQPRTAGSRLSFRTWGSRRFGVSADRMLRMQRQDGPTATLDVAR